MDVRKDEQQKEVLLSKTKKSRRSMENNLVINLTDNNSHMDFSDEI